MQNITSEDLKRLAEQRLRDLENQRKRAAKLRKTKTASGQVRFSVYVPRDLLPLVKTAVQNALANARTDVTATVSGHVSEHDGSADVSAERDAVTAARDVRGGVTDDEINNAITECRETAGGKWPGEAAVRKALGGRSVGALRVRRLIAAAKESEG
jgi:hypothetical protein